MRIPTRKAVISVFDKIGIKKLASAFHSVDYEIVLTGSTARVIRSTGMPTTEVSEITSFSGCLDGRIKTLHPTVHAGILTGWRREEHMRQLAELDIRGFGLMIVDLCPFSRTVASGAGYGECIEKTDAGDSSTIREAAKNHTNTAVATDPSDYACTAETARRGGSDAGGRVALTVKTFTHTVAYDTAVARWTARVHGRATAGGAATGNTDIGNEGLSDNIGEAEFSGVTTGGASHPGAVADEESKLFDCVKIADLHYGENPYQSVAPCSTGRDGVTGTVQLGGEEMSYNSYQDVGAATRATYDHAEPAVTMVKHANPCGMVVTGDAAQAHSAARAYDPLLAHGGVVTANKEIDAITAEQVVPIFTKMIAAFSFSAKTLEILSSEKSLRILRVESIGITRDVQPISGRALIRGYNRIDAEGDDPMRWRLVSGEPADETAL